MLKHRWCLVPYTHTIKVQTRAWHMTAHYSIKSHNVCARYISFVSPSSDFYSYYLSKMK